MADNFTQYHTATQKRLPGASLAAVCAPMCRRLAEQSIPSLHRALCTGVPCPPLFFFLLLFAAGCPLKYWVWGRPKSGPARSPFRDWACAPTWRGARALPEIVRGAKSNSTGCASSHPPGWVAEDQHVPSTPRAPGPLTGAGGGRRWAEG